MGDGGLVNSLGYVRNRSVILHIDRFWTLQNDVSTNFDANCCRWLPRTCHEANTFILLESKPEKVLSLIHRKLVSSNPEAFATISNHLVCSVVKCAALVWSCHPKTWFCRQKSKEELPCQKQLWWQTKSARKNGTRRQTYPLPLGR